MSDLISRSELLTRIRLNYNNHQNISAGAIKDIIDTMPTAYDIDMVVEELEEAKHEICLSDDDLEHYQNGIDDAIEIVKQGDVYEAEQKLKEMEVNEELER